MLNFLFTKTPLFFFIQSLWRDEAFSYLLAKKNVLEILTLTVKDFNPPLYYLVLHFWMKVFGSSEIALRSLSLLFYVFTLYVLFEFLKNVLGLSNKKSFVYFLLLILNPVLVYYAFEARMYSMLAFFASLSFYLFITKKPRLYIIATILGLYTHYFMIFVVLTQILYSVVYEARKTRIKEIKTIFTSLLIFSPWVIYLFFQKKDILNSFWIFPGNIKEAFFLPVVLLTGYEKGVSYFSNIYLYFSLFLIFLLIIGFTKKPKKKIFYYLNFWVFIPLILIGLVSLYRPLFLPRYTIFIIIGFNLLIIYILNQIKQKPHLLFFLLILAFIFYYNQRQVKFRQKEDIRKTIVQIKKLARPGDLLYITSELDFFTAQYYFGEERVYIFGKSYDLIPSYIGKILIPKDKITFNLPNFPQKAFILKRNGDYDILARY